MAFNGYQRDNDEATDGDETPTKQMRSTMKEMPKRLIRLNEPDNDDSTAAAGSASSDRRSSSSTTARQRMELLGKNRPRKYEPVGPSVARFCERNKQPGL